jgi:hypothetical protein
MKRLLAIAALICLVAFTQHLFGQTYRPTFTAGHHHSLTICAGVRLSLDSLLSVMDQDTGQVITWRAWSAPMHGSATVSHSDTTNGDTLLTTGLHYVAASSYSGADTFSVVVADTAGADTAYFYISVNPRPVAGSISITSPLCVGDSNTATAATSGGTWVHLGSAASLAATTFTGVRNGVDTVYYIITNSCGADSARRLLRIDTPYTGSVTIPSSSVVCRGDTVTLSGTPTGGTWSVLGTSIATIGTTGIVRGVAEGIDTIMYIFTNGCGSDTAVGGIRVLVPPPAVTVSGVDSVCGGSSITLTPSITGGAWTSSNTLFASVSTAGVVRGNIRGNATITYTLSNRCGTQRATHPLQIDSRALPIFGDNTLCALDPTPSILIQAVPGGRWSSSNPLVAFVLGGSVWGVTVGTATVTYTLVNACGTSTESIEITVEDCNTTGLANSGLVAVGFGVAPNPSIGRFEVSMPADLKDALVTVTDITGRQVLQQQVAGGNTFTSSIATKGLYIVRVAAGSQTYTSKLIIE